MIRFTDSVQQQVRNHLLDQLELSEAQQQEVKQAEDSFKTMTSEYDSGMEHISADARLSKEGKAGDIATLKQQTWQRAQHITQPRVEQLKKQLGGLEKQLETPPEITDPVLQHLKEVEIRGILYERDPLTVLGDYQVWAVEGGNDLAMEAVEGAPSIKPLIDDASIIRAGKKGRALRQSPQAAAALEDVRSMLRALDTLESQAKAHIDLPADDPLRVIAGLEPESQD